MYVKFGDTNGHVFSNAFAEADNDTSDKTLSSFLQRTIGSEYKVGTGVVLERGVVIFDRYPSQDTSSVPFDQIINLIKNVHSDIAPGEPVVCYLPKFSSNVYNETLKIHNPLTRAFKNISIIPV